MAYKDSLISWWSLDEESGERVDSHGSNNLTDVNTVLYGAGKRNNAGDFEVGTSEYLEIADNADLSFGDEDVTFAGWVKLESKGATRCWLGKRVDGGGALDYNLFFHNAGDDFRFGAAGAAVEANNLGSPSLATWYFIVCWHDAAGNTINIQVNNGTADSAATGGTPINDGAGYFAIGAEGRNGDYWDGLIDEVAVWNRVLTSGEKDWLYDSGAGRTYTELDFVPTSTGIF